MMSFNSVRIAYVSVFYFGLILMFIANNKSGYNYYSRRIQALVLSTKDNGRAVLARQAVYRSTVGA